MATSNARAASESGVSIYTSTVPKTIRLVGSRGGVADDAGTFTVIAHDIANNPVQHADVVLDFTDAVMSGAIRLSTQQQPGTFVDCAYHSVRLETDANGMVTFRVMGAGYNHGGTSDPGTLRVKVFANGYRLNPPIIATFDEDSDGGVGPSDFSAWARDLFSSKYESRSDFNGDGALNGLDLSMLADVYFRGSSSDANASWCP